MGISEYEYTVEQCDVPEVRRNALKEYRDFRRRCLEYLRGDASSSVMNQIHSLAWHTAVFRTLNEARRLEQDRPVNGAMWELIAAGYNSLMALGIRRLVDRHPDVDSVWNILDHIEKQTVPLTRENFVCYDGIPFDSQRAMQRYIDSREPAPAATPRAAWISTKGPNAWTTSQFLHKAFNALSGYPSKQKRMDRIRPEIIQALKAHLEHPSIKNVCTLADKVYAHAERLSETSTAIPPVTYSMVEEALRRITEVASFISTHIFYDTAFGSVVPVPQFNVLEFLDQPWAKSETLPALHEQWRQVSETMTAWTDDAHKAFLPQKPGSEATDPTVTCC